MNHGSKKGQSTVSMQSGMSTAIVTDNNDPEALGRVRLAFAWSDEGSESTWARVSTFMAGEERGFYFIPEVGDEVLVAFLQGDTQYPVVIGTLWNADAMPPQVESNDNNDMGKIRSRSGHEIVFDDNEEGGTKLEISSAGGHKVVLDDRDGGSKIEILSASGQHIVLDDNNGITIEESSGSSLALRAGGELKVKSSVSLSLEAVNIDIKASGVLTLEGAMVRIN